MNDKVAYAKLRPLFDGCMKGRTMYVVPFIMGPLGSPLAKVGVEITDSIYVVQNMGIMTRMGNVAWKQLGDGDEFTRCLHSIGDVNPDRRYICHFPLDNTIWSFGSGYGGNALLGKKCLALRIASYLGRDTGLDGRAHAAHGRRRPEQGKDLRRGGVPQRLRQNQFRDARPARKVPEARAGRSPPLGDDIVWMWVDEKSGKLRAINPEAGYFGVVPGTNSKSNPNAIKSMARDNDFYQRRAGHTARWQATTCGGKTATGPRPRRPLIGRGKDWTQAGGTKAAHPNSRFTAPATNNPVLDPAYKRPRRRPRLCDRLRRATQPDHSAGLPGVQLGPRRVHRRHHRLRNYRRRHRTGSASSGGDPMAMLPFIGYNIRDYLVHWFRMRKKMTDCPRIFMVNWFRKNDQGRFMWPGFGENMRVLKWIVDRAHGRAYARETPVGWMPRPEDIDLDGAGVGKDDFAKLCQVDSEEFKAEIMSQEELFLKMAGDLPKEMIFQRELLISRL